MATRARKKRTAEDTATVRLIGGKQYDISNYDRHKTEAGHVSFDNGDDVAKNLRAKTLDAIYAVVAKKLKVEEKELRSRYKHLNPGMQRMSLGNLLRKATREAA